MDGALDSDRGRQWFFWGMVLAWMPLIPLLIGLFNAFRGIPTEKATGLAAVAAIVQLGRSWSGASGMRALFALLSICWSAFVLIIYGLGAGSYLVELPRLSGGIRSPQIGGQNRSGRYSFRKSDRSGAKFQFGLPS
jgi:hypothetical protein